MPSFSTPGVVLKRRNYKEADRILTVFTKKLGKVTARSRGVRKIKSKLAGHLEPLSEINLYLVEGKLWYTVAEASLLHSFDNIKNDLKLSSTASFLAELIDYLMKEEDPHKIEYEAFILILSHLNSEDGKKDLLVSAFVFFLFSQVGFMPELYRSVVSDDKLPSEPLYFSSLLGGLLTKKESIDRDDVVAVSANTIKVMRIAAKDFSRLTMVQVPKDTEDNFKEIVEDYTGFLLERKLHSQKFIKEFYENLS